MVIDSRYFVTKCLNGIELLHEDNSRSIFDDEWSINFEHITHYNSLLTNHPLWIISNQLVVNCKWHQRARGGFFIYERDRREILTVNRSREMHHVVLTLDQLWPTWVDDFASNKDEILMIAKMAYEE